ncbi:DUF4394 domain-containing protein [Streptomyces sp. A7024]|uniref:DUF4394 domain-containing protein n=1 Tax=Streptomyces coryli TaxID=1128680 RepID=A0A6G4U8A5_9ACTN|nr:DUF4394 domain-containing protein [Streptomyces coryli]NGN68475.1 DUF4394 domain-containing protein [Streptomyces coryli]
MRNRTVIGVVGLAAAAAATVGVLGGSVSGGASGGEDQQVEAAAAKGYGVVDRAQDAKLSAVGLTDDGRLAAFRVGVPEAAKSLGKVSGLKGDQKLIGIDYRVQNNKLYGVGDMGGIYTIATAGAEATKVSQLTVALQGKSFGVDFNPAANRLRVISDTGQNLRHNIDDAAGAPAAGTTATDGNLTNPPVPPAPAQIATGVTAAAYTNNDLAATTATTLFDVDTALDQVSVQSPANAGNLAPTGKLGVDTGPAAGFDIYTAKDGDNTAFATLDVSGKQKLYRVDLLNGQADAVGSFPDRGRIVDLAIALNQG